MPNTSQKIAENVALLAWARVSMALALPAIGLIFMIGWAYVDKQFADTTKSLDAAQQMATAASEKASKVNDRLIALKLGEDGIWRAKADKSGSTVDVALDYQGNVTEGAK